MKSPSVFLKSAQNKAMPTAPPLHLNGQQAHQDLYKMTLAVALRAKCRDPAHLFYQKNSNELPPGITNYYHHSSTQQQISAS